MRGRVLFATAELYKSLNPSKYGKFLKSCVGTEWLKGILGFIKEC